MLIKVTIKVNSSRLAYKAYERIITIEKTHDGYYSTNIIAN